MKKTFDLIKKNKFQTAVLSVLVLLVLIAGVDVYARVAGKISSPIGTWPTDDKGYIGYPTDATLNPATPIAGDDSVYSMLGKIYSKAGAGSNVPAGTWNVCGYCYETNSWGAWGGASSIGCCGSSRQWGNGVCSASAGSFMAKTGEGGTTIGYYWLNLYSGPIQVPYTYPTFAYYICYKK